MSTPLTGRYDYGSMSGAHFFIDVQNGWVRGLLCDNPGPEPIHAEAEFAAPIGVVGQDFPANAPGRPTVIDIPANRVAATLDAENEPTFDPNLLHFRAWTL